ncbi:patatin-like phospholipase family protein [Bradyrhizobium sp. 149]|uniref:patatin-like phospholipase family protein n=1 Tax=Bradyrhizobium sp. 149 TaxID=2782624 RepID=UPI001FF7D2B5|nr:patatin-like phospholipase family protein [Bradyrhizobium sp. 149]MCK1653472.1 patatin-like phospholipase family protein [Bradyrhizobium sp. 149]
MAVVDEPLTALVFSGGLGLGAYHGGAFDCFTSLSLPLHWVTGSSAGAITTALIAGSAPSDRVQTLRRFWQEPGRSVEPPNANRHLFAWMNSLNARLFGRAGFFYPRLPIGSSRFNGLYDLGPTRDRLRQLIEFERLNAGDPRVTICATDVESGDAVLFDSRSQRIEMDHILASCGFIPEFAPVSVSDRWLVDGGFSLNAPFDPVLEVENALRLYIIDLYARDGQVPDGIEAAAERKSDLMFGNQTLHRLHHALEARRLRAELCGLTRSDTVHLLSYRPGAEEAGPEKSFDLSEAAMAQRWQAGFLDMQLAAGTPPDENGIRRVRRK